MCWLISFMMLSASGRATRAFLFVKCPAAPKSSLGSRTHFDLRRGKSRIAFSFDSAAPFRMGDPSEGDITLQEWQGWGTTSPLPSMVMEIVEDLKALEKEVDANMSFGGVGGKLQGNLGIQEDKKHRVKYQALGDSEKKLQFYAARQIACRLLGSRGYLCQKCWLPMEDCMCSKVTSRSLGPGDFLRQNNTGKILWQVFGVEAATLCLFGIPVHEEIMWDSFKLAGKGNVWCLYPNKSAVVKSVQGAFGQELIGNYGITLAKTKEDKTLNFILIDGTWSNSAAMFRRLQDQANSIWGDEDLPCISLTPGASAMHKLRPPQPPGTVPAQQRPLLAFSLSFNFFHSLALLDWISKLKQWKIL
ncbi:uncharacterized protein LOC114753552 [Neltuma alba]|uniref:uncharacterized protein LOC114753552 n=1 Tax=Neltuma alba TaxID=207710 RepID=UPI0010A45FCC|nr:uncharacterized protein LOC114753552 [Prosopis alba]